MSNTSSAVAENSCRVSVTFSPETGMFLVQEYGQDGSVLASDPYVSSLYMGCLERIERHDADGSSYPTYWGDTVVLPLPPVLLPPPGSGKGLAVIEVETAVVGEGLCFDAGDGYDPPKAFTRKVFEIKESSLTVDPYAINPHLTALVSSAAPAQIRSTN